MATITKRNNSYLIRVSCGYDTNGKQIVYSKSWKPDKVMTQKQEEKELQKIAVLFEEQCASGQYLDGSIKFADFTKIWLERYAKEQLRATTVFNYEKSLVKVNEIIGHYHLDKLQPHHLLQCYEKLKCTQKENTFIPIIDFNALIDKNYNSKIDFSKICNVSRQVVASLCENKPVSKGSMEKVCAKIKMSQEMAFSPVSEGQTLSGKTLLNYHRLISSVLETAVKWQIILSNPCKRVSPPKAEKVEAKYLDEKQSALVLEALQSEPLKYRALFSLLLYSGMRRGEICGLSWSDVDFRNCIIDISKSSLYLPGKGVFEDKTKNTSSMRTIKIPKSIIDILRELRSEQLQELFKQGSAWQGSGDLKEKIFTQANGKPIHPCTVTTWFAKFLVRHNLESLDVSPHSLRHTNATLLIASGVDLRTVSKRLGHAQMTTTANTYTHAIRTADEIASQTLDDILIIKDKKKA